MLKAEAIDLKDKNIYFQFECIEKIQNILYSVENRKVENCLQEIKTEYHKEIDKIVFDYLGLDVNTRNYIVETFENTVRNRTTKTKNKV